MIDEYIERFIAEAARSLDEGDWEAYGNLFAEDLYMVTPGFPAPTTGRDVRVEFVQGLMVAFPRGRVEFQRSFGQGDWACFQLQFTGTRTGPMAGADGTEIPAINKAVKWPYCMVCKFEAGVVTEIYEYYDQMDLMVQLGLMS